MCLEIIGRFSTEKYHILICTIEWPLWLLLVDKTQKCKDAERPVSVLLQYLGDREDGTVTVECADVV